MIYPSSHESILSMYREMISYYIDNLGNKSKYSFNKITITSKLIKRVVSRYNKLVPASNKIILNGELKDDGIKKVKS